MAALLDFQVDTSSLDKWIFESAQYWEKPLSDVMRDAMRNVVAKVMGITPPHSFAANRDQSGEVIGGVSTVDFSRGSQSVGTMDAKAAGEMAVERDIRSIITGVESGYLDFLYQFNRNNPVIIDRQCRRQDGTVYVIDRVILDRDGSQIADFHRKARNRRGVVPEGAQRYTKDIGRHKSGWTLYAPKPLVEAYIEAKKKQVGLMAAGWLPALEGLGGSAKRWINRHGPTHGTVAVNAADGVMSITATHSEPWNNMADELQRRAQAAIQYQGNAMARAILGNMKKRGVA